MRTVNIHEAKSNLSKLIAQLEKNNNESVIICRHGKPVAEIKAIEACKDPLKTHPQLQGTIKYDPTEPLFDDEWPGEYR